METMFPQEQSNLLFDKHTIETPEQLRLDFAVAGIGSRFLALAIDTLIQMAVVVLIFIILAAAASVRVLASISRSLPVSPSSTKNMPSAIMKLPSPKEALPSLVQTSLPSKLRQVNRPRFFLPTANMWPLYTIGVCTSLFHSLFFMSNTPIV